MYGNGEGNVLEHIIRPTYELLRICKKFNVILTIFFEVVEYWKLEEAYSAGKKMGYVSDPAKLMEEQIIEAYKEGHDVQLHLHPQWLTAEYVNGKWQLNSDFWILPSVPYEATDGSEIGLKNLLY